MDFIKFISENYLLLVPVLWIIGTFLKRTPKVPDWAIVWILLFLGVGLAVAVNLGLPVTDAVLQGVLVAGAAVLGHQLIKQVAKKDDNITNFKNNDMDNPDLRRDEQYYKRQVK